MRRETARRASIPGCQLTYIRVFVKHMLRCGGRFDGVQVNIPIERGTGGIGNSLKRGNAKEALRIRAYAIAMIIDVIAIALAFASANLVYTDALLSNHGVTAFAVFAPIYVTVGLMSGAYSGRALESLRYSIGTSLHALVYSAAIIMFVIYMLKAGPDYSRGVVSIGLSLAVLLTVGFRVLAYRPLLRMLDGNPFKTILVCDGISFDGEPGDTRLYPEQIGFDPTTSDPFHFDLFARAIGQADRVIVGCSPERYAAWTSVLKSLNVDCEIVTDLSDHLQSVISIGKYSGHTTMLVNAGPLRLRDRVLKRALDLSAATLACLLLLPLFIAVAIAIKVESKGPVLFKQHRIGRNNRIFKIYKFRSMYTDMCDATASQLTTRSDPRVTRVGDFIRRTSIDELPQILNILKGDMSLVGPRPHALSAKAADKLYWDVAPTYRHRHSIKPGLTGLAQVRGFRGNTEKAEDLNNRLRSDLEYVANWSLSRDLRILFQTMLVLRHSNAF